MLSVVSFVQIATAQTEVMHKNGFGIKAGVNVSNVHTQKDTPLPFEKDSEAKLGFYLGIFAEVFVNEDQKIAIQPEIFYSQDGYKISDFQYNNTQSELKYNLRSFNIPILFKYYFTKNFNVYVGPQAIYQESQRYDFDGEKIDNAGVRRRLASTNIAAASGLEYATTGGFSIHARYVHGAHTLYKKTDAVDVTHRSFQFGFGYKF